MSEDGGRKAYFTLLVCVCLVSVVLEYWNFCSNYWRLCYFKDLVASTQDPKYCQPSQTRLLKVLCMTLGACACQAECKNFFRSIMLSFYSEDKRCRFLSHMFMWYTISKTEKECLIKNKGYLLLLVNIAGLSSGDENNWEQF